MIEKTTSLNIAVICGGSSMEAVVSRSSGSEVAKALKLNYPNSKIFELDNNIHTHLDKNKTDLVFPVLHGPIGEDGTFQGFLEIINLPYVGNTVHASSYAMNKFIAKKFFENSNLPTIPGLLYTACHSLDTTCHHALKALGENLVIKPCDQGSGLGVEFISGLNSLKKTLKASAQKYGSVLIERQINGRELTVGILAVAGQSQLQAFPVIEIKTPENSWYDYKHRYTPGLSEHIIPASLSKSLTDQLTQFAYSAHQSLGCRDLSRIDFLLDEQNTPFILEVNTMPGMTATSLYPEGAKAIGIEFPELLSQLVENAWHRDSQQQINNIEKQTTTP
ncbi:D-alanine--D-alanine ligase B [Piscirickettsia salmonis]|uniref:D-alanine--D-alanine ligase n=1 Tax=Piscirickettsia salmonis TaxID=1238 RepID=A0A1L6TAN2_PISSA|nr:D-alanine--D-alanine ligase [Piscirickettsia salmonis]AKP73567.1 hypothetical protein PSLF89_1723 [Piscirickettsia salmonis LF-89 = ATCC VR-1361]ALB22323.1 D-alanine-D-alanine ligase [Piscirickettsia salmonis]ALY02412.1 hypothetical protein AWE47_05710 [Piscirickettsia salmonis]AMA41929.1 hypothetical protein AWJ11_05710 [Piscirickettsia salmonis]AOS34405.1 hypothetical protein AVM72_02930 [Piscirickettsia salmonis]